MGENALLSVREMYRADALAAESGVPSLDLMEAAGRAVAELIRESWPQPRPVAVLCGPGNNGGDGFVVARLLKEAGWPVRLALLGARDSLKGDAAVNAGCWDGPVERITEAVLDGDPLVVDALFGAGLGRALEGEALGIVEAVARRGLDCVAVDVPSGVHGDSGQILGAAIPALMTVTFFRPKPGHFLLPGRDLCGDLRVADIGIPESVLDAIAPPLRFNGPEEWLERFPWPTALSHKYTRGHAVILGGDEMTGAARLAARAARRVGAGLVTIAAPPEAVPIYAADSPGNLVRAVVGPAEFEVLLSDPRRNALLIGPGAGITKQTRREVPGRLGGKQGDGDRRRRAERLRGSARAIVRGDPRAALRADPARGRIRAPVRPGRRQAVARLGGGGRFRRGGAAQGLRHGDRRAGRAGRHRRLGAARPGDRGLGRRSRGSGAGLAGPGHGRFRRGLRGGVDSRQCGRRLRTGLIAEDIPDSVPAILFGLKRES